ncbi:permease prefix domain 1-containing protein [Lederbergia galactosidilytica]|uniref:2TM domain-containing protein n=1 Tax=Lederbergia galactosidilytica TaxID=217031 RepID=A0A177ZTI3_9BACI|nr:permease prefix domain 1-containing protein [Lederbergia galactosidilytica]KRG13227.1 hypothetical protein ACA30_16700 [Virgibacillus soli]MBP1915935.1 hypothetical protein [Lederbergia galactosidilytica]OAK71231.1 hypothetical protein ABB05_10800 [Lederbergia galactosidilytica]
MKVLKNHVQSLFRDIPNSEQKEALMDEVLQNLEEKVWDLMEQGKAEEDAVNKAIVDFGDIEDLKQELGVVETKPRKNKMRRLNLGYSLWGSSLIIALVLFINLYYTPHTIWFVYPTFVILWWPLTMYFSWLRNK